jgi:hypothetical protein
MNFHNNNFLIPKKCVFFLFDTYEFPLVENLPKGPVIKSSEPW